MSNEKYTPAGLFEERKYQAKSQRYQRETKYKIEIHKNRDRKILIIFIYLSVSPKR